MSEKKENVSEFYENIEPFSLITDILRNLWAVFLGSAAVSMIVIMFMNSRSMIT